MRTKLYLAHPLELRHAIREKELLLEKKFGIELLNPFYDTGRDDIHRIDRGEIQRSDITLSPDAIVHKDLDNVDSCQGVLAYIEKGVYSIGTICECWHTLNKGGKPIYVVSPNSANHPWVRYFIAHTDGASFSSWEELEKYLSEGGTF